VRRRDDRLRNRRVAAVRFDRRSHREAVVNRLRTSPLELCCMRCSAAGLARATISTMSHGLRRLPSPLPFDVRFLPQVSHSATLSTTLHDPRLANANGSLSERPTAHWAQLALARRGRLHGSRLPDVRDEPGILADREDGSGGERRERQRQRPAVEDYRGVATKKVAGAFGANA
jgi:hypothetical protein